MSKYLDIWLLLSKGQKQPTSSPLHIMTILTVSRHCRMSGRGVRGRGRRIITSECAAVSPEKPSGAPRVAGEERAMHHFALDVTVQAGFGCGGFSGGMVVLPDVFLSLFPDTTPR